MANLELPPPRLILCDNATAPLESGHAGSRTRYVWFVGTETARSTFVLAG